MLSLSSSESDFDTSPSVVGALQEFPTEVDLVPKFIPFFFTFSSDAGGSNSVSLFDAIVVALSVDEDDVDDDEGGRVDRDSFTTEITLPTRV